MALRAAPFVNRPSRAPRAERRTPQAVRAPANRQVRCTNMHGWPGPHRTEVMKRQALGCERPRYRSARRWPDGPSGTIRRAVAASLHCAKPGAGESRRQHAQARTGRPRLSVPGDVTDHNVKRTVRSLHHVRRRRHQTGIRAA